MKTSKLRVIGLCAGNSPATGKFPAQMASNAEKMFPFDDIIIPHGLISLSMCIFEKFIIILGVLVF